MMKRKQTRKELIEGNKFLRHFLRSIEDIKAGRVEEWKPEE